MDWLKKARTPYTSPLARILALLTILGVIVIASPEPAFTRINHPEKAAVLAATEKRITDYDNERIAALKSKPTTEESIKDHVTPVIHQEETSQTPRIALHPLNYSQYQQQHDNGEEMSELITSLLMTELGKSVEFELLDRSLVSTLFAEKSNILVNNHLSTNQNSLKKLPLSNLSLVGSLFSGNGKQSYNLKLIKNKTGEILAASQFNYTIETLDESITEALTFIQEQITKSQSKGVNNNGEKRKIAFGHFIDINKNDAHLNQGRKITDQLIETFVKEKNYLVLARTQVFPLVFEEYLRLLQHTDEHQNSLINNTNYFIHGKYRVNNSNQTHPISIYLYIHMVNHGRELIVLHAENWGSAYQLINDTIVNFSPTPEIQISAESEDKSKQLFLESLHARGMLYDKSILTGKKPPTANDINSFKSSYKPEHAVRARELIKQAYTLNPHNQLAKLARAVILESEGDAVTAEEMIVEVLRNQGKESSAIAFTLLNDKKRKLSSKIHDQTFEEFTTPNESKKIKELLIKYEYVNNSITPPISNKKFDQIFNRSHNLTLGNLAPDTTIKSFEKLRSIYDYPGTQIKLNNPRRSRTRDNISKRTWHQSRYRDKHNIEAKIHFDIASTTSNIHINDATSPPSIAFYPEVKQESDERRLSNLEIAVDGFSSSVYLDTSYLKAMVLLGHSLCQKEIGRCASGNMINSWVVENTKAANIKGRGGMYFDVTKDIEEKDRLIFLAANAIDRVTDANLTELYQHTLTSNEYLINKYEKKLETLLADENKPVLDDDLKEVVHTYTKLIEAHCIQLEKHPRELNSPYKYIRPMEALAKLARQNKKTNALRKKLLADIETSHPNTYPYLVVNAEENTPFIAEEQDEIVAKVASRTLVPLKITEFMEAALKLFEARVESKKIDTAKQYLQYFSDYYSITENTAMDFAYLYYRVGDLKKSQRLLTEYGKLTFRLSNFTEQHVDGDYKHNGFEGKGQLKFTNKNNPNTFIIYKAFEVGYGLGEKPIKWSLSKISDNRRNHPKSGNNNSKHPGSFAFGNGGAQYGEMIWISPVLVNTNSITSIITEGINTESINSNDFIDVTAIEKNNSSLDKNNIEHLFSDGYYIDSTQQTAIKGLPNKPTAGPLQDSYFHSSFYSNRKIKTTKEKLFEKGYLTVTGVPTFNDWQTLYKDIEEDFSEYSEFERRNLREALSNAKKVNSSGFAEIYHRNNNIWEKDSTLIPEDAITGRNFGFAFAIHEKYALICDYKDGVYSFTKIDGTWKQQQRIQSRCKTIAINNEWAIIGSEESVLVYKNDNGYWEKIQTLIPKDYLINKDKGSHYRYFGSSLAITKDNIIIGNPNGGLNRRGEVYLFTLSTNKWLQTNILQPNKTNSEFGRSISATSDYLIIGDPSTGALDTPIFHSGSVFIYKKEQSHWKLKAQLVPKDRPKYNRFGKKVLMKIGQKPSILIKSKKDIYRYDLESLKLTTFTSDL